MNCPGNLALAFCGGNEDFLLRYVCLVRLQAGQALHNVFLQTITTRFHTPWLPFPVEAGTPSSTAMYHTPGTDDDWTLGARSRGMGEQS